MKAATPLQVPLNGVRIVGKEGPLEGAKLPGRLLREFVN